eukprot:CAMPEP_0184695142 /NCGR_PEP_ID=MMETSP0313-20130426/2869_1 /TAXON_ID=2792 /ORGANISM="Porphyridium aerugineum, Strain SAG 1380-2" /LENGTH=1035 /DNA_ID=CAMNT_0027153545 /DNA_START=141 /DNA_END=3248 /DNA_ORIENTATION=-
MKSYALTCWLFGSEIQDMCLIFKKDVLVVLVRPEHLSQVKENAVQDDSETVRKVEIVSWKDAKEFQTLLAEHMKGVLHGATPEEPREVGCLVKEKHEGSMAEAVKSFVETNNSIKMVNANELLADVFSVKDEPEITKIRRAALLSSAVFKNYLKTELETILDDERKVQHDVLAAEVEKRLIDPSLVNVQKLKKELCDVCYIPIIQSGGDYDLKPSAVSDERILTPGCIVVSLGSRYAYYCSNASRTFLIDASPEQQANYEILLQAFEAAMAMLKPGSTCADVYEAAVSAVAKAKESLVASMTKSVGFMMGIEFREGLYLLNAKTTKKIEKGMCFNLSLGFQGLNDEKMGNYALLVADTVLVTEGQPEILTSHVKKVFKSIAYNTRDENEEEEEEEEAESNRAARNDRRKAMEGMEKADEKRRRATAANSSAGITSEELERRKKHQEELGRKKLEEGLERLRKGELGGAKHSGNEIKTLDQHIAYSNPRNYPSAIRPRQIYVDIDNECVLVPINGVPVPFHISTIKNCSKSDEGSHTYVRINFMVPQKLAGGIVISKKTDGSIFPNENKHFIKELTFRSASAQNLSDTVRKIKELRKRFTSREQEEAEQDAIVEQAALQLDKRGGKIPILLDVSMRPNVATGKNNSGTLEAHLNGFRYRPMRNSPPIDILYANIKIMFFQEAINETIVLVHFHLKDAIMVGKKKTQDVQFYAEVMEAAVKLNDHKRRMYDQDELEEEQRERELRNKMNKMFHRFTREVEERYNLEFDIPYRTLGFHGAPKSSSVFLMPTVSCIIDLIEWPPFVLNLSDVEIAHFERVHFQLRNFDLVFVFKGFEMEPSGKNSPPAFIRISSIPMQELEMLKKFLDEQQIKYYEGPANLNWPNTLKTIRADLEGFYEDGGWEFLNMEGSVASGEGEDGDGEDDGSLDEGDEAFEIESDVLESAEDSDDSDYYSEEESEDARDELEGASDAGEAELDSDEEGEDWEELEEKARKEDKRRGNSDEDEEARKKRDRAGAVKGGVKGGKPSGGKPSGARKR